VAVIVFLLKEK